MIRPLEDNDAVQCINLMSKSWDRNDGYGLGYINKNEVSWIEHLMQHIRGQRSDANYFTQGVFEDGQVTAFLLASTFRNFYTEEWTMDVKDCIVDDENRNTVFAVTRLYDAMFEHMKQHGGIYWRADSVRSYENCEKYAKFLQKKYNASISLSMRGSIGG